MRTCPVCNVQWPSVLEYCLRDGTRLPEEPEASDDWLAQPAEAPRPSLIPGYKVGDELRGHVLEEKLGDGAMGAVWRAHHALLHKSVAIKALHPDLCTDSEAIRRFFREAQVVNTLNHPHIVSIIDFVDEAGRAPYIVMEYLDGECLEELITPEALLPLRDCFEIARQIADAMATVHDGGIVHRDLKPDNVFVQHLDQGPDIKLLDFGLAKFQLDTHALLRTQTGSIVGTPTYMSPEQIRGKTVDHRTDIYAMGCILYGLLTGDPPFIDEHVGMLLKSHLHEPPIPPTHRVDAARAGAIPAIIERAALRCLAKAPEQRIQSMQELAQLLAEAQRESYPAEASNVEPTPVRTVGSTTQRVAALPPPPRSGDRASTWRPLMPWIAIVGVALLLIGGLAALVWNRSPANENNRARSHRKAGTTTQTTMNANGPTRPRASRMIRVISIPTGAALVNPRTGQTLWKTPALVQLPVDRPRQLSVELRGYQKQLLTLTPQTTGPVEIALQPTSATRRPRATNASMNRRQRPARPLYPAPDTDTVNPFD